MTAVEVARRVSTPLPPFCYESPAAFLRALLSQQRVERCACARRVLPAPQLWSEALHARHCRTLVERTNEAERRALLVAALQARGLSLRSDSSLCRAFVAGTLLKSPAECAAMMAVTGWLMRHGHRVWSEFHTLCDVALRVHKLKFNTTWSAAIEHVRSTYGEAAERTALEFILDEEDEHCFGCSSCGGDFSY